jgi:hypothetical protein
MPGKIRFSANQSEKPGLEQANTVVLLIPSSSRGSSRVIQTNEVLLGVAILVRVPPQILEDLVGAAISKQGNIYRGELAKLIGASKESLDGKTSFYLISLMKLCGLAEADMAKVLKKSRIVNQRGAVTRDISAGEELKGVIDNALEGFQMLISESFKPVGSENPGLANQPPIKRRSDENPKGSGS